LSSVSCSSSTFCFAVGEFAPGQSSFSTLLERWNGTKWSLRTSKAVDPGADLQGISCSSSSSCIAVGSSESTGGPLAASFNGTKWTIQAVPLPAGNEGGSLAGVSCSSGTSCTAVGSYANSSGTLLTLAEILSGTSWTVQATPNPAGAVRSSLAAVSCTAGGACTAVGTSTDSGNNESTLAEARNGTSWLIQTTSSPSPISMLQSVSCSGSGSCTAVGQYFNEGSGSYVMLAEADTGGTWTVPSLPSPANSLTTTLLGVSCRSASDCTAVGSYQLQNGSDLTLVEVSSGSSWSIQTTSQVSGEVFASVSCTTTTCEGVGVHFAASGEKSLAEVGTATSWTSQSVPATTGSEASSFSGISCFSASDCTAVGNYQTLTGSAVALAEHWSGTAWSVQVTPRSVVGNLDAVSCPSTNWCTAVGSNESSGGVLVEARSGTTWSIENTPTPAGATPVLNAVSCVSATDCTAVGDYNTGDAYATLVESWNGSKWSIVPSPSPGGNEFDDFSALDGVWCSSSTSCLAVGTEGYFSATDTLAEVWNGVTWTVQTTPNPAGATESTLSAISCSAAATCIAVGIAAGSSGNTTLALSWSGGTWAIEATPNPVGATDSRLLGVSCNFSTCAAVGQSTATDGTITPLAEGLSGTSWSLQSVAPPAGAAASDLAAVACPSATPCTAAGQSTDSAGEMHGLVEDQS
jgi:hypothetical protein